MSDPYQMLGVPATASDETIRAAYLAAVRACPPERNRQRFEQVRAAFETVGTERKRMAHALFDTRAPTVHDILGLLAAEWRAAPHTGPPTASRLYRALGQQD